MRIENVQATKMVGEQRKKELVGEVDKWNQRTKVWEKLKKVELQIISPSFMDMTQ